MSHLNHGCKFFLVLILSFIFLTPGVRNLFEREVDRWAALTKKLDGVILGQGKDRIWWKADSKGVFSVKSALLAITTPSHTLNTATTSLIWNWNFRVPKKVEAFLWTLFYRGTNTAEHLQKKLPYWALSPSICGQARSILIAERVALNFMQRMSGIATLTKAMADAASPARILETRKTAPGLRLVDKWAVLIGGGQNHRMGLFDMVLIKDNHISAAGSIINAIKSVDLYLQQRNLKMDVEVETRTLEEVHEVLHYATQKKTSLTRMMLDNMVVPLPNGDVDVAMLKEAVDIINGRFETEASGNVTLHTVQKIGQTGVTYISSGALTHSVKALDISLKIDTELALQVGRRTKRA